MAEPADPSASERARGGPRAPRAGRERTCLVTRQALPEDRLIRLVAGPDGGVAPDLAAKLPGRGAWITADRATVDRAVAKGLLARALKRDVRAPADLADRIEASLAARCLSQLGLARRARELTAGFDQVRAQLRAQRPAYLIEARDAAPDGRRKVVALATAAWGEVPVADCFTADEIGAALGAGRIVHAALLPGPSARRFAVEFRRLSGFRKAAEPQETAQSG